MSRLPRLLLALGLLSPVAGWAEEGGGRTSPPLPPIPAPLGRVGDVIGPLPQGGVPAEGLVVSLASLPGCERGEVAWLDRFRLSRARTID